LGENIIKSLKQKMLLFGLVVFVCVMFVGCNNKTEEMALRLSQLEPTQYKHPGGFSVSVPGDWQVKEETENMVFFVDEEDSMTLLLLSEIGGYDYLSLAEAGQSLVTILEGSLSEIESLSSGPYGQLDDAYKVVCQGEADGTTAIASAIVWQPLDGVRYYAVFLAGVNDYEEFRQVFDDICGTIKLYKTQDEIYEAIEATSGWMRQDAADH